MNMLLPLTDMFLLSEKSFTMFKLLQNDISTKSEKFTNVAEELKVTGYHLITATSSDQINKFNRFALSYIFNTYDKANHIYYVVNTNSTAVSIANLYSSSIWLEREIYDLFGIYFIDTYKSNDLRRILTDYHFKGHPFRKDFPVIGYRERVFSYITHSIRTKHEVIF